MGFSVNRVQWICSPLIGWALLSGTISPSWGQTPAPAPDNTGGTAATGGVPGAGGTSPSGTVPGTIVAPTTPTTTETTPPDNTTQPAVPAQPAPTPGATASRPAEIGSTTSGFAGTANPLTAAPSQISDTGNLIYGAPVGTAFRTIGGGFGGVGGSGGGSAGANELGIEWGAFTLYPAIDVTTGIDNNAYAQSSTQGTTSSGYMTIVPSLELRSNWLNHELRVAMAGGFGFYSDASTQNYTNYNIDVNSRIDMTEDAYFTPSIGYRRATEALGTPNVAFAQAPTVAESVPVKLGFYQRFNRFFYEVSGSATRFWFTDHSVVSASGIAAPNRDRMDYAETVRFGYDLGGNFTPYMTANASELRYVLPIPGDDRDSNSYGLGFGGTWTPSATTSFDGNIGYTSRSYTGGSFSGTSEITGSLSGSWNQYAPLTLRPSVTRSIQESALAAYKSITLTTFGVDYAYVIRESLTAIGGVSYSLTDYNGADGNSAGTPRTDTTVRAQLGFQYALNPRIGIGPVFEYTNGSSTDPTNGPSYSRETISLRLSAKR